MTRTLLLGAVLLAAPSALAQQSGGMDHSQMDHSQMPGMSAPAMDHEAMMALHERMMADPEVHARMMADPEMQALMQSTMPADHAGMAGMNHAQMSGMNHGDMPMGTTERAAMAARMRERMAAMSPADHSAFMARMEAAHRRLMADPAVRARMMADPETHRMMMAMPGGMPGGMGSIPSMGGSGSMPGMDHSQMTGMSPMSGMDHSGMAGMDHGSMQMDDGTSAGHERAQMPDVDPQAFDASATAERFHEALAAGDRAAMQALLMPDAIVMEGGAHEAATEYLAGHFSRDAAMLAGTAPESLFRRTGTAGDAAWVASTQRIGTMDTAELLVMQRMPEGWRIAAVHWSSAR